MCERNLCAPRRSRARPSRVLWWPVFSPRLSYPGPARNPARQDGRILTIKIYQNLRTPLEICCPRGFLEQSFQHSGGGIIRPQPAVRCADPGGRKVTGEPENIRDLYFRRQCPISNSDSDCAQHSATRPPGEMSVFSTDLAHGRYAATIRRAPCQDPERHSAALRSVCGGLAAAGEDGALDDVAGAASTGRIGGRPHRSRCNEPASRT